MCNGIFEAQISGHCIRKVIVSMVVLTGTLSEPFNSYFTQIISCVTLKVNLFFVSKLVNEHIKYELFDFYEMLFLASCGTQL